MRCGACEFENPAGFRFCGQCGTPLATGARAPAPGEPRSYTPGHLVRRILSQRSALEGERKQVTVLFADVKGSLELAEQLGPEEWHSALDRLFHVLASAVHRYEGTVNQYTGDGMMALFGAPIAHEDHAQRACRAGLEIAEGVRAYADAFRRAYRCDFRLRMGLNSGEVVVGKIGDDLRMDYTAQGHVVGLASRMEEIAEPGRIYVSEQVERLVRGFFRLEPLGRVELDGVSEPVAAYELCSEGAARTRLDLAGAVGLSRLVGRERAIETLVGALETVRAGRGLVLGVEAGPGVGKSRLCLEFVGRCRRAGVGSCEVHCPSHGRTLPYSALQELLRSFFGLREGDPPDTVRDKIYAHFEERGGEAQALAEERGGEAAEALALVSWRLGLPASESVRDSLEADERQRRLARILLRLFKRRAEREPFLVLVDDLHWIDVESEAFLRELAAVTEECRTLLLVNFRPEYGVAWMPEGFRQLGLSPLDSEASLELIRELIGEDPSVAALPALIRERAGGNPLFIEELIRSLVESGRLAGPPGQYALTGSTRELEIPATIHALIASRIDRLRERDKLMLQAASVVGKSFSRNVVARLVDFPDPEITASMRALHRLGFVRRETQYREDYAFLHPLTREVAYRSLLAERRVELHGMAARALVEIGEKLGANASLIAHHFDQAKRPYHAARWRRRAGFHVTNIVPRGALRETRGNP